MIARIWRGVTPAAKADEYLKFLERVAVKDYSEVPGNRGVHFLRRFKGDQAEFVLITFWDSFDAIRQFAGPDYEKAVYYPEDPDFLLVMEPNVTHYDLFSYQPES
jgi:heme-degrading monooxygenase HmoA